MPRSESECSRRTYCRSRGSGCDRGSESSFVYMDRVASVMRVAHMGIAAGQYSSMACERGGHAPSRYLNIRWEE